MIEQIKDLINKNLSPKKIKHTLSVANEVEKIAKMFGISYEKMYIAALLHDITREWNKEEQMSFCKNRKIVLCDDDINSDGMLHSITGAAVALDITGDTDISNMIRYHTTARAGMTLQEKIIFFSDFIEPERQYANCILERNRFYTYTEHGKSVCDALDVGIYRVLNCTIYHLSEKDSYIHPDTLDARNFYLNLAAIERNSQK